MPPPAASHDHAISLRSSAAAGRGGVVGRAETPMDVVVDRADVLHERVHTRPPASSSVSDFRQRATAAHFDISRANDWSLLIPRTTRRWRELWPDRAAGQTT